MKLYSKINDNDIKDILVYDRGILSYDREVSEADTTESVKIQLAFKEYLQSDLVKVLVYIESITHLL